MSATTVLPDPTSPCSSRCIGAGLAMSAAICAIAAAWSSVSGNGSAAWNAGTSSPSTACDDAGLLGRQRALARDERELHAQELVELQPLRGHDACRPSSSGRWMSRYARAAVDEVVVGAQRAVERIGEPARLRALAGTTPPRAGAATCAPRPSPTAGTRARCVPVTSDVGVGVGEHVDDRVGHLALAAVALDLAEHRHLRARAQLPLAPGLVEEHDLEQAGAVVDGRVDDRALAVARAARADRLAPRRRRSPRRRSRARGSRPARCGRGSGAGSARAGRARSRCPCRRGRCAACRRPP